MFEFILGSADQAVEQFVFGTWEAVIANSMQLVTALMVIFVALIVRSLELRRA